MAISPDSTSYPCLAVIEAHGLQDQAAEVYRVGRLMLAACMEAKRFKGLVAVPRRPGALSQAAFDHLARNYRRAAEQFGWLG